MISWRTRQRNSSGCLPALKRYAYFITCREVVKNAAGEVTELRCVYDPATKGGNAPDGRKVKATLHWVSAQDSIAAEVRLYNPLFSRADPAEPVLGHVLDQYFGGVPDAATERLLSRAG